MRVQTHKTLNRLGLGFNLTSAKAKKEHKMFCEGLKKKKKRCFCCHLGQIVDMSLVDKLVVRRSGAALVDAEEVLLGNICKS